MAKMSNFLMSRFFCIACGNEGIPLARKRSNKHKGFHRKRLYCPHCRLEVNHVECTTDEEVFQFREDFENGLFQDEATESMMFTMTEERKS